MATYSHEDAVNLVARKELLLVELEGWMKSKGLWKQALKELGWNISG